MADETKNWAELQEELLDQAAEGLDDQQRTRLGNALATLTEALHEIRDIRGLIVTIQMLLDVAEGLEVLARQGLIDADGWQPPPPSTEDTDHQSRVAGIIRRFDLHRNAIAEAATSLMDATTDDVWDVIQDEIRHLFAEFGLVPEGSLVNGYTALDYARINAQKKPV